MASFIRTVVIWLIPVIVIIAILGTYTSLTINPSNKSTLTTNSGNSTAANAPNGLQLRLSVESTIVIPDKPILIDVSEFNTLATTNNISAAASWKIYGLRLNACGTSIYPFGVVVLQGRYTAANQSEARPLHIFPPGVCPALLRQVSGYVFQPQSDLALILPRDNLSPISMSAHVNVSSVYTAASPLPLAPGLYTVVAGDEWGDVSILYVDVSQ